MLDAQYVVEVPFVTVFLDGLRKGLGVGSCAASVKDKFEVVFELVQHLEKERTETQESFDHATETSHLDEYSIV